MSEPPPRGDQRRRQAPSSDGVLTQFQVWETARNRALKWQLPPFECDDVANRVMDRAEAGRMTKSDFLSDVRAVRKYTDIVVKNALRSGARGAASRAAFNAELATELQLRQASGDASDEDVDDGRYAVYDKFVDGLGERCRVIWGMRYLDGLKLQEIADMLDISLETVRTHIRRGLRQLEQRKLAYDNARKSELQS